MYLLQIWEVGETVFVNFVNKLQDVHSSGATGKLISDTDCDFVLLFIHGWQRFLFSIQVQYV